MAMPGIAAGSTWRQVVCHRVAPSASEPNRISCGTDLIASREAMMTTGRISRARVMRGGGHREAQAEGAGDQPQAEDAVDDRRHGGEVLDVDLDER